MQNSSDKNINRVAIYIRVSTNHQIDRDSLPMQRQDLISYAKLLLNTEQSVIFEDAGYDETTKAWALYSSLSMENRPYF